MPDKLSSSRRRILAGPAYVTALATGIGLCLAGAPFAQAQEGGSVPAPAVAPSAALPGFAPLVKRVMPAVVNISVNEKPGQNADSNDDETDPGPGSNPGPFQGFPPSPFDQFLRHFFDQQGMGAPQQQRRLHEIALGSGFIIDPTGYIVTNNHVVENADKVTVIFQDGSKHTAKIIGRDPKTDLALLKIEAPQPLPYVSWGDSDAVQVGDWVLAVGNPFGLGGTVSPGFLSARGRDIHEGPYDDFLQIDASINKGNSGGPSFNLAGEVIGINTAIYSPDGGSVGIGFAIPANLAKPVIEQLREHGKVERGWLGVQIQQVTPEIAKSLGLPTDHGALVSDVTPGGPAEKAGFRQGDVILSFNGHEIDKLRDLPLVVAETPVGHTANVKVWRKDGDTTLSATIAEMPANAELAANGGGGEAQAVGLTLAPLTPDQHRSLHVPNSVEGVVVVAVANDSKLGELGLQPGDVIESINQQAVTTPQAAASLLAQASASQQQLLVLFNRHGVNQYVAMTIGGGGAG